jgi:hypothetical protein
MSTCVLQLGSSFEVVGYREAEKGQGRDVNVGELRKLLRGLDASMPVALEIDQADMPESMEPRGISMCDLSRAVVEERGDEVERLYLWGDEEELGAEETRAELSVVK